MGEKLHKVLARTGLGSRREIEGWIKQGRVFVNGKIALVGARVEHDADVAVDGRKIVLHRGSAPQRVLLYHKPEGEICTRVDPRRRPTVFQRLPRLPYGQWIAVGRLDVNTSGLLLFTTDGELAQKLMHPRYGMEREYLVRVSGVVSETQSKQLTKGVRLDGVPARFKQLSGRASPGGVNRWYRVVITQGRYREVRRLFNAVGLSVSRLKRIRFGITLLPRDLRPGEWRELRGPQLTRLLESVALVATKRGN